MSFSDVWLNRENNLDYVFAEDVNLFARYISKNENDIQTIKQNIKKINYYDIDSFQSGYAIVEETKSIDSPGGPILINSIYPLFAEMVETFIKDNNLNIKLEYGAFPDRPYDSPAIWGNADKIQSIMSKM